MFDIKGTKEHAEQLNQKLIADLAIYKTRPFLNKAERCEMQEYRNHGGGNHIISILNFDNDGHFLPEAYSAPLDMLKMLYPIDDIVNFERQGTIIIDHEQYTPELRNLSFFIYLVDEELYNEMRIKQNFRGIAPTFMFDKEASNGVRVFESYFALARHLKKSRFITVNLGPRATFYMRYYMYQMHVHKTEQYAFGEQVDSTLANSVIEAIQRHLAFRQCQDLEYQVELTVDNYSQFRKLSQVFKMHLPEIQEYKNKTMIQRFSKITMHSQTLCRLKTNRNEKYRNLGIEPYHHLLIHAGMVIAYVWDTRDIQALVPVSEIEQDDLTYNVIDNRTDLKCKADTDTEIRAWLEEHKNELPVQFRDTPEDDEIADGVERTELA